ncbi:MAG TPA: hypothetical protein PLY93_06365 [Turneriella sp.]|nr:hypothetical protein [Turneriella sp.]
MLKTSISLPQKSIPTWAKNHRAIMRIYSRFLRVVVRKTKFRRGVKRLYNKTNGRCAIMKVKFTPHQYDSLHTVAAGIRVSVSFLIFYLIQFWEKASQKNTYFLVADNYAPQVLEWSKTRVPFQEKITFRRVGRRFFTPLRP